ncbi:hypothetical protein KBTX_02713 [wastewater metagenome]|uniref:DUF7931 domain-containing protein n=2 Tax=unclassified sequences TaxID=12908 RepID=A0A5B8REU7_9ZZZZ|nr:MULTISPECIES: hypothetical protein [Arhodomonas]MCS4503648.1 hypothetical protein [Arhodomonas aquaeolei]QEA06378.1 hypothetical protein KBTEX_02713 [uncultured organism]
MQEASPGEQRELADFEALTAATDRLGGHATTQVEIISPDLEPRLYDREAFTAILERFCLDHRGARIRIMVGDPYAAVRHSRRLIPLARRLTSYFELRRLSRTHARSPRSLFVVDDRHAIYRPQASRPEGVVIEDAPARVKAYLEEVESAYAMSEPDTELRGLSL